MEEVQAMLRFIRRTIKNNHLHCKWLFNKTRDPAGARTQDPNIKSVVLYLLSYGIVLYLSALFFKKECKGSNFFLSYK